MTLPTGLLPVFVFVVTAGIATLVTLGAHLSWRRGSQPFSAGLRRSLLGVSLLYLVGTAIVWAVAGGGSLWGVAAALVASGVVAFVVLWTAPLLLGQYLVRRLRGVDSETALRQVTYGWLVAMLAVFGLFVAPGGPTGGHLLHLDGVTTCLAGFCGLSISLLVVVALELVVAVVGPGLVGFVLTRQQSLSGR
ncbi:hypothetical protein C5B90_04975 [Haloferax sp. Atlit-12N]|uniref:hypothetical protein n=1 Tax=Haloferax sp. Atlit-12N TaxID=2077203 RepID=UPI000E276B57|nr:hypothetical protein [Haloferax sp. Atlit-12N]RDZ65710.1 hypothetical protein C5B90_04975 [Haloferax sp. Atlit-12N]